MNKSAIFVLGLFAALGILFFGGVASAIGKFYIPDFRNMLTFGGSILGAFGGIVTASLLLMASTTNPT